MVMTPSVRTQSLVSVIVTCYQTLKFLKSTLDSIRAQSHRKYEVIVVDCTSEDPLSPEYTGNEKLTYIKIPESSVSAARNRGVASSNGKYLVFLDASDLLYTDALMLNSMYLDKNDSTAFVSGSHRKVNYNNQVLDCGMNLVLENHYLHLLQGNYIEMHGAVMYQRWVFDQFQFDDGVDCSSDYDLFLKVSRQYPIHHHHKYTAAVRVPETDTQDNISLSLKTVQTILKRQRKKLLNKVEKQCLKNGLLIWENYYCEMLFRALEMKPKLEIRQHLRDLWVLLKYNPKHAMKVLVDKWVTQEEKIY